MPHTKIGSRSSVMPLVRIVITVVSWLMLATVVETAKTTMANREEVHPDSRLVGDGTEDDPAHRQSADGRARRRAAPPRSTNVQRLRAFSRGKAMSRAPTMIGITKLPHGPAMATIRARIITMPWIAMKLL